MQYKDRFAQDSVSIKFEIAKSFKNFKEIPNYDLVVLQKTILSTGKVKKIAQLSKKFIYDADDRIWLRPLKKYGLFTRIRINHRLRTICKYAKHCMVSNEVIATDIRKFGGKPNIIEMGLDGDIWHPKKTANEEVVIGWTGAPVNLLFLENILKPLKEFLKKNANVKFVIHCGKNPNFKNIDYEYVPFSPGNEPEIVRSFDIGLLPLPRDDPFTDGKSPIKGIQYLASGLTIISSKTLSAENIFKDLESIHFADSKHDWFERLTFVVNKRKNLTEGGQLSRKFFENTYDSNVIYRKLKNKILQL